MKPVHPRSHDILGNPRLQEEIHDPYFVRGKYRDASHCTDCGAVYYGGRWQWAEVPDDGHKTRCPACRRIEDGYPAGEIIVKGAFAAARTEELLHLIRNVEAAENDEHPLNRIMDIRQDNGVVTVTTTDIHLPRRIGHALERAWDGELSTHYDEDGWFARVTWLREQ